MRQSAAVAIAVCVSRAALADVTFTDQTFDLDEYTTQTFRSSAATTITVGQTSTGGNPGSALQVILTNNSTSATVHLRNDFVYDPEISGPVTGVDFSGDIYLAGGSISSRANGFFLYQGGQYYRWSQAVPIAPGWQSTTVTALGAGDFNLVTNFLTGTTNSAVHPNFAAGPIQIAKGARVFGSGNWDYRLDNLSITFRSTQPAQGDVPLPIPALLALGAVIAWLGARVGRRS
jgi:hypothetical protein